MEETAERIVEAYAMSVEAPDSVSLAEWIQQFPDYERELTEFAVAWARMEGLPAATNRQEENLETQLLRSMSIVRDVMHTYAVTQSSDVNASAASAAASSSMVFPGIVGGATRRGLTLVTLAERLDLSPVLVRKLDRRLIALARIPLLVIESLAALLGQTKLQIEQYLQGPQQFALGARHKAPQGTSLAPKEDFFDAVRAAPDLTDEQRQRWLALEPDSPGSSE
jgi:hypothetical protein